MKTTNMNRTIKFRAWNKENKQMRYLCDYNHDSLRFNSDGEAIYFNVQIGSKSDEYELMQFTGITDKNGKEIYEGDIIKLMDDVTIPSTPEELITEVFYWQPFVCFALKNTYMNLDFTTQEKMEVIGNIYENPNLLK